MIEAAANRLNPLDIGRNSGNGYSGSREEPGTQAEYAAWNGGGHPAWLGCLGMQAGAGLSMSGADVHPAQLGVYASQRPLGSWDAGATGRTLLLSSGIVFAVWSAAVTWRLAADVVSPWDSKNQFYAFFRFLASALHSGSTPFWNPYHYGGHPSIADPQSLIFAPAFVLWALFDPAPSMLAFDILVYAHLLAGGLAVVAIGWRAGWPVAACVLAAVVFMFGGCASSRMQHTGAVLTYAMFPSTLLLLQLAMQRRSMVLGIACGVSLALLALGRNQIALLFCFALFAAALAEAFANERPTRYLVDRAAVLAAIGISCVAIIAVPALLTMQFAALSNRPAAVLERAFEASLYPANLATLLVPDIFGSHSFPPWGPNYETVPEVASVDESFNYLFVGSLPVILLLWLGVAGGGVLKRGRVLMAAVLTAALLYMLGRYTPFFGWAFHWVPGIALFRRPIDGSFVFVAALAILTGHLLSDYVRNGLPKRGAVLAVLLAALMLAVVGSAIAFSARTGHAGDALRATLWIAPVPALVIVALLTARTAASRQLAAACVVAVAVAELLWWNVASRLNAEGRHHYAVLEQPQTAPEIDTLDLLERNIRERQRAGERPRVEIMGVGGAWQNLAMVRGLEATNGYNPLRIGLYDKLISPGETTYLSEQRKFPASFESYDCALARALGLEYLVLDRPIEQVPNLAKRPVAELLRDGPKFWLYRLQNPMPRLVFTDRVRVADADLVNAAGGLAESPSSDGALIDDDTPPARSYSLFGAAQSGSARIASWRPDRIEIEVDSQLGGMLVLHETYYPGWVAEIDGQPARILRADVLFRGVEVPPGRHDVVFRFAPLSFANLSRAFATTLGGARR